MIKNKFSSIIDMPSKKQLEKVIRPFSDEELELTPDVKSKVNKLMEFFDEAGIDYGKFDPESIPKLDLNKRQAYPNQDVYMHIPGQHNTNKWLQAVREIYFKEKDGSNRVDAIRRITSGWNIMETYDFLNWLRFHEAGEHMKYKFAGLWYENPEISNYVLHVKPDPVKESEVGVHGRDIDFARDESNNNNDKKQIIEKQRNKIIGRLDSAEKLLRSPDGQIFSGREFEALLEAVYQLKKKIQLVNKVSTATKLYEDMIVREANILHRGGFIKAADLLYSLSQTPAAAGTQAQGTPGAPLNLPPAAPPAPPTALSGAPGGLPSVGPGMPQGAPTDAAPKGIENQAPAITELLEGMDTAKFTSPDKSKAEDDLEVEDSIDVDDADTEIMVTEAQAMGPIDEPMTASPAPAPLDPSPVKAPVTLPKEPVVDMPPGEEPLEVTEDDIKPTGVAETPTTSDFDNKVNAVLSGVTVADVVAKLEDLAKFYKTREAPRQLGIVDMMLDSLGLASYFPSLAEATNKSLESNNYISTRVEDILSKLRGAMAGSEIDLKGGEEVEKPEVAGIKNKLKSDEEKEKNRKQMRKDQEASELSGGEKETPEVEIEEDLGAQVAPPLPPAAAPPRAPAPPA